MSQSTNQKSELQHYYLQEALAELKERVEDQNVFVDFDEFSNLEEIIDRCLQVLSYSHIRQYERLCELYIRKVIKGIQLQSKSTTKRYTERGSYFYEQSLKIEDTNHFHFSTELLENNFLDLVSKLYVDVKELGTSAGKMESMNKYQKLIKSDYLPKKQCIGCNENFLQFSLLKGGNRQYGYELEFIRDSSFDNNEEDKQNPLARSLLNKINFDSEAILHHIIRILNTKGGFICFGCKEIQQFKGINDHYSVYQIRKTFMQGNIVIGHNLTAEKQEEIRQAIYSLCLKITPKLQIGYNITVSFRPILPSPYTLGFDFQEQISQESGFYSKGYNVILVKIHPTAQGEYYENKGPSFIFEQNEDSVNDKFYDSDYQAGQQEIVADKFFDLISMSKEDLEHEKCGRQKEKRSYFDKHDCI